MLQQPSLGRTFGVDSGAADEGIQPSLIRRSRRSYRPRGPDCMSFYQGGHEPSFPPSYFALKCENRPGLMCFARLIWAILDLKTSILGAVVWIWFWGRKIFFGESVEIWYRGVVGDATCADWMEGSSRRRPSETCRVYKRLLRLRPIPIGGSHGSPSFLLF